MAERGDINVGETTTLRGTFTRAGATATPLQPVYFYVRPRGGDEQGPFEASQASAGVWEAEYTPSVAGIHDLQLTSADGLVEEAAFVVKANRVR